ncbi:MAG: TetR/AcrR family transcriptional regulator [Acidimicrobiia bacterium]|nr:TetR/AcrR family transcriptional regulator [Acidimicrobiia bacterium]
MPADVRRAERRLLLLDAAFDLLGTEGWAGTTVRAVCQRAELNPRYFYESFDDLDALVVAVYDRIIEKLTASVERAQAAAAHEPAAQVRAAVEAIVAFVDDDRRRARILYVEALGNEALNRRRRATGHALVSAVEEHAAASSRGLPPGEQAGRLGAAMLVGGLSELLVEWLDGRITVSREELIEDATTVVLALGEATAALAAGRRKHRRRSR